MEVTVLYYSSNREEETFEERIRKNIAANCGNLPIISVTQKPIDFGRNICVGVHESSYFNQFRQMLIGLKEITTKYTLMAEADFLYPPDYFTFVPENDDYPIYRKSAWVLYTNRRHSACYLYKSSSEGAQIVNTEAFRGSLERWRHRYCRHLEWDGVLSKRKGRQPFERLSVGVWTGGEPVVTFKTGRGVRPHTKTESKRHFSIPYWGEALALKRKMFGEEGHV